MKQKKHRLRMFVLVLSTLLLVYFVYPPLRNCFIPRAAPQSSDTVTVRFLSVGQGDATLLTLSDGSGFLIDTGPADFAPNLTAVCIRLGVTRLVGMVITHPHDDHIGGACSLLNALPVEAVYLSEQPGVSRTFDEVCTAADRQGVPLYFLAEGMVISFGPLTLTVLSDGTGVLTEESPNNRSAILRLDYADIRMLFAADGEKEAENLLLSVYSPEDLQCQLLKVGHHGSDAASADAFLAAVQPRYGIISCGKANTYSLPGFEALTRLQNHGIEIIRTDWEGTVTFRTDGHHLTRIFD